QEGRKRTEATHQVSRWEDEQGQRDRIAQGHRGCQAIGELKMTCNRWQCQRYDRSIQGGKKERKAKGNDCQPAAFVEHRYTSFWLMLVYIPASRATTGAKFSICPS